MQGSTFSVANRASYPGNMCMHPRLRLSMEFCTDVQQILELQDAVAVAGLLGQEEEHER